MGVFPLCSSLLTLSMFRPLLSLLFLMLVVAAVTADSSEPRVARLTRLGCSLDQVIMCSGEIESAWSQCWDNTASWFDCIQGILGASDCALCVCDVVEWLGLAQCE